MLAASSVLDSDRLAATRTNGRTRTTSRSPTRVGGADADRPGARRWIRRRAAAGRSCGCRRACRRARRWRRAACFDPLRDGGEIGLAVERRKNGAAHQGRAAKAGQDRAAEPLHRDAAAIDDAAGSPSTESGGSLPRSMVSDPLSTGVGCAACRDPTRRPLHSTVALPSNTNR